MNTRSVIGRRIVEVRQSWAQSNTGTRLTVEYLLLDNGVKLYPTARESEDSPIGDLIKVPAPRRADSP